jgi:hypothetical protein
MTMTLRLTDDEHEALRQRAAAEGVSIQGLARRAVRAYVGLANHRERIVASARRIMNAHTDAIERLGPVTHYRFEYLDVDDPSLCSPPGYTATRHRSATSDDA